MKNMLTIRPLEQKDRASWDRLWAGYLTFYEAALPKEVYDSSFARLLSERSQEYSGLIAEIDGEAVGLAHYLFHRDMWSIENTCYLQDLFVSPQARGAGAGKALIDEVARRAEAEGASVLYWHTQEFNHTARRLYDKTAQLTCLLKYDKSLPQLKEGPNNWPLSLYFWQSDRRHLLRNTMHTAAAATDHPSRNTDDFVVWEHFAQNPKRLIVFRPTSRDGPR